MSEKILHLNIQGGDIRVISDENDEENDYVCLTDIANKFGNTKLIENWLQNQNTIDFLGFWEKLNNQNFNSLELQEIKKEAGLNRFLMSVKKWVNLTNAIGIQAKTGKYNSGTFAHKDIAMEFCAWISSEFKLYLIKEFQRLKKEEAERKKELAEWDNYRWLTKINYRLQTDSIKFNIIEPFNVPKGWKQNEIYGKEADMLNKVIFGITAKEFEAKNNGKKLREEATTEELAILSNLEFLNSKMISDKIPEKERFKQLTEEKEKQFKSFAKIKIPLRKNAPLFINKDEKTQQQKIVDEVLKDNPDLKDTENKDFEKVIEKTAKRVKKG